MVPDSPGQSWLRSPVAWFRHGYDLLGRAFLVLVAVRSLLALHAVVLNLLFVLPATDRELGVVAMTLALVGWTAFISWRLRKPRGRTVIAVIADAGMTAIIAGLTPVIVDDVAVPITLAGHWLAGSALYAAVLLSTRWGIAVATVTTSVYLLVVPEVTGRQIDIVLITFITTITLGELIGQFKASVAEQEHERTRSVALAERERLSRIVHDGALQVLALVEREGPMLGPRGMRLAALARESESQLRTLLQDREVDDDADNTLVDLAAALDKYQSAKVTVSTMAGQVMVPRAVVEEVEATLSEALTNVDKHAGQGAQAWVLLDQETDDEVIVWIRDNGVGMSADQVTEASARGRMGIQDSIVGRMSSLGGSAMLKSSPGLGTEWELRFPIDMGE